MRVAIVVPPYPLSEAPAPPLGIAYAAGAFERAGASVRIFDFLVSRYDPEKLRMLLSTFAPDVLGTNSVTLNYPMAAEILCEAKKICPSLLTIMGGPHVSFAARRTLTDYPGIDLIVRGEGEKTIAELMKTGMDPGHWPDIQGLSYRWNGKIFENEDRPFIEEIDMIPLPARHLLPLSRYQALGFPISIITSRGCPHACIFCLGRRMVGKRIRQRNPLLVVDEIEEILAYGFDRINVADDLFVSHRGKVKEVCEEILRRNLRFGWSAFARVNTVDRETLRLMKRAGCDSISFGVESGDPGMLRRIRKGITLDQVRKAVSLCREVGILAHTSFIVGLPGESHDTLARTKAFAASLGSLYGYHFLTPFPGTTVCDEREQYDLEILTEDWSRYDANSAIVKTSALSAAELNAFVAEFELEIQKIWDQMVHGYEQKTNPPDWDMQVEGHFRMKLIHRLLVEDVIERVEEIPAEALGMHAKEDSLRVLCERIARLIEDEHSLIGKTIPSLVSSGYLKFETTGQGHRWFWTHSRRTDHLPQGV